MIKQIEVYYNDFSQNVTEKNFAVKYLFEKIFLFFITVDYFAFHMTIAYNLE